MNRDGVPTHDTQINIFQNYQKKTKKKQKLKENKFN